MSTYSPLPVPNLIQGVSQQSAAQRRITQQEAQENCINSPVDGAVARPSTEIYAVLESAALGYADGYYYEIKRADENYLVKVYDGTVQVFNLASGAECSVTYTTPGDEAAIVAYLEHAGSAFDKFSAQGVSDFLFIANKTKIPAMAANVTDVRPNEALIHFKAGNYKTKYSIGITHASTTYKWTYETPDNSVASNAQYITTNHLAATFFRALTAGSTANKKLPTGWTSGDYDEPEGPLGQEYYGAGGTGSGSSTDITTLGFGININGNSIHIWHETDDFVIDVDDGGGNTALIAFKDFVQTFTKLPVNGFANYVVKVQGDSKSGDDDYYVRFTTTGSTGAWEETIAPNTPYKIDPETMPVTLKNTGVNTFELALATWGERVAGDLDSDPDPYFIGSPIVDLMFNDQRLGVLTEAAIDWSKAENAYVFFKATVQTELAGDPIHFEINAKDTPIFTRGVVANEATQLWAQDTQFAVRTADQAFKAENISVKPATAYQYADNLRPISIGQSFYFGTEEEQVDDEEVYTTIRDVLYREGKFAGDNDVTAHVPRYIPAKCRFMSGSDTRQMLALWSQEDPLALFVYNFYIEGQDRVQSAWQRWSFPRCGDRIVWMGFRRSQLRVIFLRTVDTDQFIVFTRIVLSPRYKDPGGQYHTRMDLRVDESDVASVTYDGILDESTVTFNSILADATNVDDFLCVCRTNVDDEEGYKRGKVFSTIGRDGTAFIVSGDLSGAVEFYAGFKITSYTELTRPTITVDDQPRIFERIDVGELEVLHAATGYYRAEVTYTNDVDPHEYTYEARVLGDPNNLLDTQPILDGSLKVPVRTKNDEFTLRLINDSHLPSQWQSAQWSVRPTTRNETKQI